MRITSSQLTDWLRAELRLPVDHPIGPTSLPAELGIDSMRLLEIALALEAYSGVEIDDQAYSRLVRVEDLRALVCIPEEPAA